MTYLQEHKRNIKRKKPLSKHILEPGAIIMFDYIDEDKKASKPMVLVLNPSWEGNMHCLKLNLIPEGKLQEMVKIIKLWYSKILTERIKLRLPLVKVNVGNPKTFYERRLKSMLTNVLDDTDVYREYAVKRMTYVHIVDYNFKLI